MADILIRGMEMPKSDDDYVIFTVYGDGGVVYGPINRPHVRYKHRAVPLQEGHGRLIDGDALRKAMYHEAFETDSPMQKWESGCWIRYKMLERNLENAPTIVPAEGGSDNG